ncbi:MAG: glycerophosphodiester phosphodiesterase [Clostridiales bacterium]|jgi:glycerophosphoryl diester phosphodiesterase|nr:glycerophosphodiester phosphodiesterase [Clostridiales bacterium]
METQRQFAKWLFTSKIAHRGLHNEKYPENSIPAFQNAVDNGFNIETDLHILKDGKIALFHDLNTLRVCGIDSKVAALSSGDLKNYRLNGTEYTVPLLEDLLAIAEGKTGLLLELKATSCQCGDFCKKVYDALKDYKGDFAVQSFNPMAVLWFKKHAPEIFRGQLSGFYNGSLIMRAIVYPLKSLRFRKLNRPDFIAYNVENLPNKYSDAAKRENLKLLAWTVKTPANVETAESCCDNYIFEGFIPNA